MTDKQIIIDGVDVSGCLHYSDRDGYCEACKDDIDGYSFTKCSSEDNCYYKQLLRKEQECDMWKNLTVDNGAVALKHQQKLDQLKAENDTYKKMLEDEDVQLALTEMRSGERHIWYNKANKLSKTLTEIKELCQKHIKAEKIVMANDILQKISDVEDET